MLRESYNFIRSLKVKSKNCLFVIGFLVFFRAYGDPPIEDRSRTFLQLTKNMWLHLKKGDWEKNYDRVELILGSGTGKDKKIIWSKVFETDDHRAWNYAYFIRLKPGRFVYDLDGDGNKEFAVATYDLGNNIFRPILIFSIRYKEIIFVREHGPYNLASDESVFR